MTTEPTPTSTPRARQRGFILREDQLAAIQQMAEEHDRSLNWVVRHLLDRGLGTLQQSDRG